MLLGTNVCGRLFVPFVWLAVVITGVACVESAMPTKRIPAIRILMCFLLVRKNHRGGAATLAHGCFGQFWMGCKENPP